MTVLSSGETKKCLKKILDVFDAYCVKHGIEYWIDYGTLLGAVRHKGFIPWDDDIDVTMPRKEYEKLNECTKSDPFPAPYEWISFENGKSDYPFGKLVDTDTEADSLLNVKDTSLWIDVFPLDGVPGGEERKTLLANERNTIAWFNRSNAKYGTGSNELKKVARIPLLMYAKKKGSRHYGKILRDAAVNYPYESYPEIANTVWGDAYGKEVFSKEDIYPLEKVMFEGSEYPAVREYKKRLKNLYGEYMKLPDEKERRTHSRQVSGKEGTMRELSVTEYKKMTYDILVSIAEYLEKHNLNYVLFYGTLLGAVRHKGYIPWDDDIDIAMPRPDYEQFRKLLEKEPIAPYYIPASVRDGNSGYPWTYIIDTRTKIEHGPIAMEENLYVDVFPLDGLPDDEEKAKAICAEERKYHRNHIRSRYPYNNGGISVRNVLKLPLLWAMHHVGPAGFAKKMEDLAQTYPYDTGKRTAVLNYFPDEKEVFERNDIFPAKELEFEGRLFKVPGNYDRILSIMFGNYMELPPEDQRVGYIHKAYLLDETENRHERTQSERHPETGNRNVDSTDGLH